MEVARRVEWLERYCCSFSNFAVAHGGVGVLSLFASNVPRQRFPSFSNLMLIQLEKAILFLISSFTQQDVNQDSYTDNILHYSR